MKTIATILLGVVCVLTMSSSSASQALSRTPDPASATPDFVGIMTIAGQTSVIVGLNGKYRMLNAVGDELGPYSLTSIDPAGKYLDFTLDDGVIVRAHMRKAEILRGSDNDNVVASDSRHRPFDTATAESVDRIVDLLVQNFIILGFDRPPTASMLKTFAEARLNAVASDPDLTGEEKQARLERMLNGTEEMRVVGPRGISEEEARKVGMDPKEAEESNFMLELGKRAQKDKVLTGGRVIHMDDISE